MFMTENKMKKRLCAVGLALLCVITLAGCSIPDAVDTPDAVENTQPTVEPEENTVDLAEAEPSSGNAFSYDSVPAYAGQAYVEVNNNTPYFTADDLAAAKDSYELYGDLDSLGRCTVCIASLSKETEPTTPRGRIGMVKPTGWHTVKYAGIDGNYLYNRCHLIGYQLSGENANEKNLITGTRYLNVEGMLPFENKTADYIEQTGNHVLYRVTPVFLGNDLLSRGVLMEAESVEDGGTGLQFCVFCYNVQPNVTINYATGESQGPEFTGSGR